MHSTRASRALLLLLIVAPWQPGHGATLGRLFLTPEERARIDRQLQQERPSAPPPRLDGIVTRSGGAPTLFLDGQATPADARHVRMQDGSARVTGPDGRIHRLKIGAPAPDTAPP